MTQASPIRTHEVNKNPKEAPRVSRKMGPGLAVRTAKEAKPKAEVKVRAKVAKAAKTKAGTQERWVV